MRRNLSLLALLLALGFGALTPLHWRAHSRNLPQPLTTRVTVRAAGRGSPWINLRDGHDLLTSEGKALAAAQPLALAAGDFDEDGVPDLLSAYHSPSGSLIVLHRGNVDAIYPNTREAEQRKARGEFTDAPFLSPALVFEV